MRPEIPKTAILVTSCWRDREKQQAIRDTWGKLGQPMFFLGGGSEHAEEAAPDELILDIPDDYQHVSWKTRQQCRWASLKDLDHVYLDHVFICDVDTYVDVGRLLADVPSADYVGWRCDEGHAAGGNGYWLSCTAVRLLCFAEPQIGYADLWVGNFLRSRGICCEHDCRFGDGTITRHLSVNGQYNPDRMYEEHAIRRAHAE